MKRILIFSLAYYPSFVSGAEAAIKEITDRIEPSDIEFHLITLLFDTKAPREERIGNTQVYRVGFGGAYLSKILFIPLAALKARSLNNKLHFNAVWSMMTYMTLPAVLASFLGVKAPRILTLQDGDPYEKVFERTFIRPLIPLLDYGIRGMSIIQVISSFLGTWPAKRGYRGIVELIYNGANPKNLAESFSMKDVEEAKQKIGKEPGTVYLLNASRLVYQKANDDTLRALTYLPENVHLVLIGEGEDKEMLLRLAKELKVENRLHLLGQMDRSQVPNYRNRVFADIYVTPSRSEGLQLSSLSAMAGRLPLIATQAGGLMEYVWDANHNPDKPETAWVVDPDSPEQIAEAVKDILSNPEKVKRVTDTARAMVLEKYDWDKIAVQMRERVFGPVIG